MKSRYSISLNLPLPTTPPPPPGCPLIWPIYRNRVWFFSSLVHSFLNRVYHFGRVCQNYKQEQGIAGALELICLMKFVRASIQKQ